MATASSSAQPPSRRTHRGGVAPKLRVITLFIGRERNIDVCIKQCRVRGSRQRGGPVGRGFCRLSYSLIAVTAGHLNVRDYAAGNLRDVQQALDARARTGRADPSVVDARGDQRQVLRLGRAQLHGIDMLFARHLRAQVRLALGALLVGLALLCELLRLAIGFGLGGRRTFPLSLGGRGTLGLGLLGSRAFGLLALMLLLRLLLGVALLLCRVLLLLHFLPRRFLLARLLCGLLLRRRRGRRRVRRLGGRVWRRGWRLRRRWRVAHYGSFDGQTWRGRRWPPVLEPAPQQNAEDRAVDQYRQYDRQDAIAPAFGHGGVGAFGSGSVWKPTLCAPACCRMTMACTTRP